MQGMTGMNGTLKFSGILAILLALNATLANAIDLDVRNPAIDVLKARVNARAASLLKWKDSGAIGEDAKGAVAILPQAKLSLGERKEVRDLVLSENEDRAALFREWVIANLINESELPAVASAFAKMQRTAAAQNHWVEDPGSKNWILKRNLR
jgi:hypothetical protein